MLQHVFTALISNYSTDRSLQEKLWQEIAANYSKRNRHYHTLAHLENLLLQLEPLKPQIHSWNTLLFTLFYHDVIYNPSKSNNEEKSAELARERMSSLAAPAEMIDACGAQILATKKHELSPDRDTNFFTDADLSILGQPWEVYAQYCKQVRQEYSIYPDMLYNPGRCKVLQHFLQMDQLYKTIYFINKLERQSRLNLQRELELLQG